LFSIIGIIASIPAHPRASSRGLEPGGGAGSGARGQGLSTSHSGEPRNPAPGHYDPAPGQLCAASDARGVWRRVRGRQDAAVERREASALRYWARDASPGVPGVPRHGTPTVRRSAPASRDAPLLHACKGVKEQKRKAWLETVAAQVAKRPPGRPKRGLFDL
jgi:hypothetical protein